ncbi:hypothetical protein HanPSC8_Chr10g0432391 [Helianthus annuus]|nr:hypothetical protein HanPSC8_Chr10g0432391 [Helianthus annuus]
MPRLQILCLELCSRLIHQSNRCIMFWQVHNTKFAWKKLSKNYRQR